MRRISRYTRTYYYKYSRIYMLCTYVYTGRTVHIINIYPYFYSTYFLIVSHCNTCHYDNRIIKLVEYAVHISQQQQEQEEL